MDCFLVNLQIQVREKDALAAGTLVENALLDGLGKQKTAAGFMTGWTIKDIISREE